MNELQTFYQMAKDASANNGTFVLHSKNFYMAIEEGRLVLKAETVINIDFKIPEQVKTGSPRPGGL